MFLDPPYGNTQWIEAIVKTLIETNTLSNQAIIYIETAKKDPPLNLNNSLTLHRQKYFGQVNGQLFKVNESVIV